MLKVTHCGRRGDSSLKPFKKGLAALLRGLGVWSAAGPQLSAHLGFTSARSCPSQSSPQTYAGGWRRVQGRVGTPTYSSGCRATCLIICSVKPNCTANQCEQMCHLRTLTTTRLPVWGISQNFCHCFQWWFHLTPGNRTMFLSNKEALLMLIQYIAVIIFTVV